MCITLFAYRKHEAFPLILLNNRDELQTRATRNAHFWEGNPAILAGKDLEAGGTWLGVNHRGEIANLTNYRDFRHKLKPDAPSRGDLPVSFLRSEQNSREFLQQISTQAKKYNGFSILAGDIENLHWFSNQSETILEVSPGLHGFSNALFNTPWPKVERGKSLLSEVLEAQNWSPAQLLDILEDRQPGPDEKLPDTGRDLNFERLVSPIFIENSFYGTRTSTLILFHHSGKVSWYERTFDQQGNRENEQEHQLQIQE